MALNIQLNESSVKLTGEINEKLQSIIQDPIFERIRIDKKNFVNTIIEVIPRDELINRYREALGLKRME